MARQKRLRCRTVSPVQAEKRSRHQPDNPPPSSDHQFTLPAQPQTPLGFFWASSGAAGAGNSAQHTGRCSCSDGLAELSFAPAVRQHDAAGAGHDDDADNSDTQDTASSSSDGGSSSSGEQHSHGRSTSAASQASPQHHHHYEQQQQQAEDDSMNSGQPRAASTCFSFGAHNTTACSPDDDASASLLESTLQQWDLIGDLAGCLLELAQA